jgi:hypothetical protein
MTCTVCGRPKGISHSEESHTFARRRKHVEAVRRSETLIHELVGIFPDLAPLHAPGCARRTEPGGR